MASACEHKQLIQHKQYKRIIQIMQHMRAAGRVFLQPLV